MVLESHIWELTWTALLRKQLFSPGLLRRPFASANSGVVNGDTRSLVAGVIMTSSLIRIGDMEVSCTVTGDIMLRDTGINPPPMCTGDIMSRGDRGWKGMTSPVTDPCPVMCTGDIKLRCGGWNSVAMVALGSVAALGSREAHGHRRPLF